VDASTFLQLLLFGASWGALYALIATGLNLIYGVMKILNIAHGELLMLGAYIAFWLFSLWDVSPLLSVPIAAAAMFVFGLIIHKGLISLIQTHSPSHGAFENATLIVFFGVMLILQNVALLLWSADYRVLTYMSAPVSFGAVSIASNRLVVAAVAVILTAAMYIGMRFTMFGKAIRAVSQDSTTARLMGIDVGRVGMIGFGIGSALAGAAGGLASMIYVITPTVGMLFTIKAFTVMVVGGLGSQIGTLMAGLSLGILEAYAGFAIGAEYKDVVGYALLIVFIIWKYRGSAGLGSEIK
jgi:branched-chain amino acid transport system permease protein